MELARKANSVLVLEVVTEAVQLDVPIPEVLLTALPVPNVPA